MRPVHAARAELIGDAPQSIDRSKVTDRLACVRPIGAARAVLIGDAPQSIGRSKVTDR